MTAGLGSQPLGTFLLGVGLAAPDESQPPLVTSRKIDHVLRKYVVDGNGDFLEMGDTASRVMLLIAFAVKPTRSIDPISLSTMAARVRSALRPLTVGQNPAALIKDVQVTSPAPATMLVEVTFVDLEKGGVAAEPETVGVEVSQ